MASEERLAKRLSRRVELMSLCLIRDSAVSFTQNGFGTLCEIVVNIRVPRTSM